MESIFLHILQMSLSADVLVVAVLLLRLLFHKAPRWIHCLLWTLVAVRLLCPFTMESDLSLMPDTSAAIAPLVSDSSSAQTNAQTPFVPTDTPAADADSFPVAPSAPDSSASSMQATPGDSVDPWQVALAVAARVWLLGVLAMAVYAVMVTLRLRRQVREAAPLEGNLWLCDHIRSPFILGVFRPRIYLPSDLEGAPRNSVVAHERAHLRRGDHWWKPLGFLLLAVYWFNPLLWVAYVLLCRDIEAACDQRVIRNMSAADRRAYSEALLSCSTPRRLISACPLAFGETGVRSRIRSVLSYKKPTVWILVVALLASTVAGVCLLTDRPATPADGDDTPTTTTVSAADKALADRAFALAQGGTLEGVSLTGLVTNVKEISLDIGYATFDLQVEGTDDTKTILCYRIYAADGYPFSITVGEIVRVKGTIQNDEGTIRFVAPSTFRGVEYVDDLINTTASLGLTYVVRTGLDDIELEKYFGYAGIYRFDSRSDLESFLTTYQVGDREWLGVDWEVGDFASFDDGFFTDNVLLLTYHTTSSGMHTPEVVGYTYSEDGTVLSVEFVEYRPDAATDDLGCWLMFSGIQRADLEGVTELKSHFSKYIPTDTYVAVFTEPTEYPDTATEKWRRWLPSGEGWALSIMMNEWDEEYRWGDSQSVNRSFNFATAFNIHGHTHYLATDHSALLRDDGALLWLTEAEGAFLRWIAAYYDENNKDILYLASSHPISSYDRRYVATPVVLTSPELKLVVNSNRWETVNDGVSAHGRFTLGGRMYYIDRPRERIVYANDDLTALYAVYLTAEELAMVDALLAGTVWADTDYMVGKVTQVFAEEDYVTMKITDSSKYTNDISDGVEIGVSLRYYWGEVPAVGSTIRITYDGYLDSIYDSERYNLCIYAHTVTKT